MKFKKLDKKDVHTIENREWPLWKSTHKLTFFSLSDRLDYEQRKILENKCLLGTKDITELQRMVRSMCAHSKQTQIVRDTHLKKKY